MTMEKSDEYNNQVQADLNYLGSQHPELSEVAKYLAHAALNARSTHQNLLENPESVSEYQNPYRSVSSTDAVFQSWYRYFMQLQLQDTKIQNWLQEKEQKESTKNLLQSLALNSHIGQNIINKQTEPQVHSTTSINGSQTIPLEVNRTMDKQCETNLCSESLISSTKPTSHGPISYPYSSSSSSSSTTSTMNQINPDSIKEIAMQINQLPQTNEFSPSINMSHITLENLNLLSQLLQSPVQSSNGQTSNAWSTIIQPITEQILKCYQNNKNALEQNQINHDNNNNIINNNIQNGFYNSPNTESCIHSNDSIRSQSSDTSQQLQQQLLLLQQQQQQQNERQEQQLQQQQQQQEQLIDQTASLYITNHPVRLSLEQNDLFPRESIINNQPNCKFSDSCFMKSTDSEHNLSSRSWLRGYHRDRYVVRITSVTYRCSCRSSPPSNTNSDSKHGSCHNRDCKRNEPRTYVTFQAQLPSLILSDNSKRLSKFLHNLPLTGLRLGFSCPLSSQGPPLSDFSTPKVAERLDAWEQVGNKPGFRIKVLSALQHTVCQMLERIRTKGFDAVKLDTDYVFFPPMPDLQPLYIRRRPLSSSSDGSLPRIMSFSRIRRENSSDSKHISPQTRINESVESPLTREQTVWSEIMSCEDNAVAKGRPRTWHQLPGYPPAPNSPSKSENQVSLEENETENNFSGVMNQRNIKLNQNTWNTINTYSTKWLKFPNYYPPGPVNAAKPESILMKSSNGEEKYCCNEGQNFSSQKQVDMSFSTPVSPTQFSNKIPYNLSPVSGYKPVLNLNTTSNCSATSKAFENPSPDSTYSANQTSIEQKNAYTQGQPDYLERILQEIANCLRSKPQYPIVVMPTNSTISSTSGESNTPLPLVFQIPHSDSVFVGFPAASGLKPRIMTASGNSAVIILPHKIHQANRSRNDHNATRQPTVLTGPKQGYLLVITPDNKYEYIPQP